MNKRLKQISIFIVVAIVAMAIVVTIQRLASLKNWFKIKEVTIAASPVAVTQIQALAQLVTVSMYEEIVVDTSASDDKKLSVPLLPDITLLHNEKKLVMVGKIKTQVGIDMHPLGKANISGTNDSIHIVLPAAKVLDAIINPSGVTIFIEEGKWNNDAVIHLKNKIQYIAIADAKSRGLLSQSENKAKEILTHFFMAAGYKKVIVQFAQTETTQR